MYPRVHSRAFVSWPLAAAAACALALASPGSAVAGKKKASKAGSRPVVTSVRPKVSKVGSPVYVTGQNFTVGKAANTVFFKRGKKVVWTDGDGLDARTIQVTLPTKMVQVMGVKAGRILTSRFTVRVKSKRLLGDEFTDRIKVAVQPPPPGDCDGDALDDAIERAIGADVCKLDTDDDGLTDYFEYSSAKSFNGGEYPFPGLFPGKRPIPSAAKPDTDGDGLSDAKEDTDTDGLNAETEQELSLRAIQMPRCGDRVALGGALNFFYNDPNGVQPTYNDGAEDSDGDSLVDGGSIAEFPSSGENIDCDGWVPIMRAAIPADATGGTSTGGGADAEAEKPKHFWMPVDGRPGCNTSAPTPGACAIAYRELTNCQRTPTNDVRHWAWLDNRAEIRTMKNYGDNFDPDVDGDGVPDGCDDTDGDGYSNALEVWVMRDQRSRAINTVTGDEPDSDEGKWDPLDACKPGPILDWLHKAPSGCIAYPESEPKGPLGPGGSPDDPPPPSGATPPPSGTTPPPSGT